MLRAETRWIEKGIRLHWAKQDRWASALLVLFFALVASGIAHYFVEKR